MHNMEYTLFLNKPEKVIKKVQVYRNLGHTEPLNILGKYKSSIYRKTILFTSIYAKYIYSSHYANPLNHPY